MSSASKVYFAPRRSGLSSLVMDRLKQLIKLMDLPAGIKENDTVAVKLHFGERGITSFLRPVYVRPFTDAVRSCGGLPFLTDANTIYRGTRSDGVRHLETALRNGFSYTATGAPVVIADGIDSGNYVEVEVNLEYFKTVRVAGEAHRAKCLLVLSHVKGHEIFGFGGALKNIGMGLAVKEGKFELHSTAKPEVKKKKCTLCGTCKRWCPQGGIELEKESAVIISEDCSGCGQCIMVCPAKAVSLRWDTDFSAVQKKTAEYAAAVMSSKKGRAWFFNFLTDITPECDCYRYSDSPVVPDIGVLASRDPVALDQASLDLVAGAPALVGSKAEGAMPGEDKFVRSHPGTDPEVLVSRSEDLGLGTRKYSLIKIS